MKHFTVTSIKNKEKIKTFVSAKNIDEARRNTVGVGRIVSITRNRERLRLRRMSLSDRLIFMQRLSSMLASRVGAAESLDIIYHSFTGSVREAARILKDRIANHGEQFPEAMESAGSRFFPEATVAIVRTGSQGGDLSHALREAVRFETEIAKTKKESGKGLFSAFSGFAVGVITILGSTMYVAPEVMNSGFVQAGGGSSDMIAIMRLADWTTSIALTVGGLVAMLLFLGVVLRPILPSLVDRIILHIPYYRDMVLAKSNYIVFFGLAVLLKAGLRVEEALTISINNSPKGELRNDLIRAKEAIIKGSRQPWPYAMKMLHPTDKASLAIAQDREQIYKTIESLSIQYQTLYQSRIETFIPLLQGFSAVFLSIAGFVLFGVSVIPLMQSSSSLLNSL